MRKYMNDLYFFVRFKIMENVERAVRRGNNMQTIIHSSYSEVSHAYRTTALPSPTARRGLRLSIALVSVRKRRALAVVETAFQTVARLRSTHCRDVKRCPWNVGGASCRWLAV